MRPKTAIEKKENRELLVGGEAAISSFFIPGEIGRAFDANEFTINEYVRTLVEIVRDPETPPREQMAAMKMLEMKAKEGMILGGLIQQKRLNLTKKMEDGTVAEYNEEGLRVVREGSDRLLSTLELLQEGEETSEVIDVEVLDDDRRPTGDSRPDPGKRGGGSDGRGDTGPDGAGGSTDSPQLGEEWPDAADSCGGSPGPDDEGGASGTEAERGEGLPGESGGSPEDAGPGEADGGGHESPYANRGPIVPGGKPVPTPTSDLIERLRELGEGTGTQEPGDGVDRGFIERTVRDVVGARKPTRDPGQLR